MLALRDLVRVGPRRVQHQVLLLALIEGHERPRSIGRPLDYPRGQLVAALERLDLDVEYDAVPFGQVPRIGQDQPSVAEESPVAVEDLAPRSKLDLNTAHLRRPPKPP